MEFPDRAIQNDYLLLSPMHHLSSGPNALSRKAIRSEQNLIIVENKMVIRIKRKYIYVQIIINLVFGEVFICLMEIAESAHRVDRRWGLGV